MRSTYFYNWLIYFPDIYVEKAVRERRRLGQRAAFGQTMPLRIAPSGLWLCEIDSHPVPNTRFFTLGTG